MEEKEVVSKNFIELAIDKDLAEGVYDHVCTRFPPEPNGYLHIGHAKSILLNYGLSQEYNGEFHMRFDDTNPTKEKTEFVDSIKADIQWLGADWKDHLYYASDYFPQMYEAAVKLIKKGKAFVCDLSAEEIREYRGTLTEPGKESPYRNRSVEENLDLFERMKNGEFEDGSKVLRAKIDMASPNINMRDPVIYRVAHMHHHRTGDTWCIYPMYDFAHPIEDAIEGITHSICTLEFEDHRPLYDWVVRELEYPMPPRQIEFAKLYLTNVVTGKRYIKKLVEEQKLGHVFRIESRVHGSRGIPGDWRKEKVHGGGMVLDWGVHLLDQILYMYGDRKIETVYASLTNVTNQEVDDGFTAILTFEGGTEVLVEVGTNNYISLPRWYVLGEDGTAVIRDWQLNGEIIRKTGMTEETVVPVKTAAGLTKTMAPRREDTIVKEDLPKVSGDIADFHRNVVAVIRDGAEPEIKLFQVMRVMKLMEAIFRSAETNQVIEFQD